MKVSIIKKLEELQNRHKEIEIMLSDSKIVTDQDRLRAISKEYAHLTDVTTCFKKWKQIQQDIIIAEQMLLDQEMRDMAHEELKKAKYNIKNLENKIKKLLVPIDPDDERGCFIEIRAGTGGYEAALFASNMLRMYSRYAENKLWNFEIVSASYSEHGGYKEIIAKVSNYGTYSILKFESGGHRVQRVPETESQGRIHTSTCTVAVMPEIPETELPIIKLSDLRIDTFRSSGAGGQHVNTTDSAIRITHLPSGIVVECQDERSQHKNKSKALAVLSARILAAERKRRQKEESSTRRNLLGSGDRSDRIRTYNFPQGRVTDHRIGLTIYRLDEIMEGKLDMLIKPIILEYQSDQFSAL